MKGQQIIGRVIAVERPESVWCERRCSTCGRGRARCRRAPPAPSSTPSPTRAPT
ncbi:MAG: hypothetical protein IKI21_02215 [Oscillospiraceae bacterium]|nr:hypothetical protein [Oscillospiraceae bacterium]